MPTFQSPPIPISLTSSPLITLYETLPPVASSDATSLTSLSIPSVLSTFVGASTSLRVRSIPALSALRPATSPSDKASIPPEPTGITTTVMTKASLVAVDFMLKSGGAERQMAAESAATYDFSQRRTTMQSFFLATCALSRPLTVSGLAGQLFREHFCVMHMTAASLPYMGTMSPLSPSSRAFTERSKTSSETSPFGHTASLTAA
mmetsp:Transcript_3877/g.9444  ORF Transcript_3877/g.9444 Transcript_3877/m.9444 type:complete len:205 (+) Transcript_3877:1106-1720(+)